MLLGEGEDSLCTLLGGNTSAVDGHLVGGFRGVVETSHGVGIMGEFVSVELNEVGTVSLGKSPNYAVGGLHI